MRDVQASIRGPFQGAKDAGTSGGASQANVQVAAEGAGLSLHALHVELVPVHLLHALVQGVQVELLQDLWGGGCRKSEKVIGYKPDF